VTPAPAGGRDHDDESATHDDESATLTMTRNWIDRKAMNETSGLSRMRPLIGDRRWPIAGLAVASILSAMAEAATLAVFAQVAAALIKTNGTRVHLVLLQIHAATSTLILVAFALAFLRLLLQFPLSVLPARIAADAQARMRANLFDAFTHASWEVQSRDREGQLQEMMTSQAGQATQGVMSLMSLMSATCAFVVLLAFAFALNLRAAGIVVVVGICMFAPLRPVRGMGKRRARAFSRAQVRYAAGVAESIRLAQETQVFGVGAAQRRRIDGMIDAGRKLFFQTQVLLRLASNVSQSLIYVLIVAGLAALDAVGGHRAGSLGAVVLILVRASSSGQTVQNSYQNLVQALPFVERLREAERRYRESGARDGVRRLSGVGSLVFEEVSYAYRAGRPVLSDICFEVAGGEVVGIVGPSGAGKSTLVQLLLRLRSPDTGRYLVNGVPAPEITGEDWHRRVAYVPQEPRLLHASVAENIRYFREDVSDEAIERAARLAHIHEDIMGWAEGYQTVVGPRADAVSGGQQQRICLARALVAEPEVLVLDEPTSALDPQSEMLIQRSLTELKHALTLFIVAHRMSTLDICDRVMIILDGKLAAFDTINHLQQHNHYYRTTTHITTTAPIVAPSGALL